MGDGGEGEEGFLKLLTLLTMTVNHSLVVKVIFCEIYTGGKKQTLL